MNKKQEKAVSELAKDFEHYQYVLQNGTNDPLWSDGINLNLIRNHIIYDKKMIESLFESNCYPELYFHPTPHEVDDDLMVNEEMIRQNAKKTLEKFNSYLFLDELKCADYYIEPVELVKAGIQQAVNRVRVLEQAIDEDDLVTMRRISSHEDEYYECLEKAFDNLCEINEEEERQMSLFEILM